MTNTIKYQDIFERFARKAITELISPQLLIERSNFKI